MLGLWVEEFAPYVEGQVNSLRAVDGRQFGCSLWSDVIRLEGAQPLATYLEDYYAGAPAVARHAHGRGTAFYVGTAPDEPGMDWLLEQACAQAGLPGPSGHPSWPAGVELVRRSDGERTWLFVLNYADRGTEVPLEQSGTDLLTGAAVQGSLKLEPRGAAVIALGSASRKKARRPRP
jgi:beta-galactosidase